MTTDSAATAQCPVHLDPAFGNDPYPAYAAMREAAPAHQIVQPDGTPAWIVTRYEDVRACLADHRRLSSRVGQAVRQPDPADNPDDPDGNDTRQTVGQMTMRQDDVYQHVMINQDPPVHTRLRQLVVTSLSAKRVDALRPRLAEIANGLVDRFADQDEVDLVEVYAKQMPVAASCELLGIPHADRATFSSRLDTITEGRSPQEGQAALEQLKAYIADEIGNKQRNRRADLLTGLIESAEQEGGLNMDELVASALQILNAGYLGTHGLIGNGTYWLLRHPEHFATLVREPSLVPAAVDELLRFDGPMVPGALRYATEDIPLGDTTIPKGSLVVLSITAANRDPRVFENPDEIDIGRSASAHIGYGYGIHYCVGARLAAAVVSTAIGTLIERFPTMRLAVPPDQVRWRLRSPLRGCVRLPVYLR